MACRTRRSPAGWGCAQRSSGSGGDDSANSGSKDFAINRGRVARGAFPPEEVAQVKAIACELPKTHGVPLSRFSRSELHRFVVEQAISYASASTIGRWLADDAIKPWQQRSWIFPRDPKFLEKAGPILDLYEGRWEGKLLEPGDCVISADAKPSIQAGELMDREVPEPERVRRVEALGDRVGGDRRHLPGLPAIQASVTPAVEDRRALDPLDADRPHRRGVARRVRRRELLRGPEHLVVRGVRGAQRHHRLGGVVPARAAERLAVLVVASEVAVDEQDRVPAGIEGLGRLLAREAGVVGQVAVAVVVCARVTRRAPLHHQDLLVAGLQAELLG